MDQLPKPKPKAVTKGKVIPFPLAARSPFLPPLNLPDALPALTPVPSRDASGKNEPSVGDLKKRRHSRAQWALHAWLVVAWLVAADRLQIAVARGEVFGLRDALAFLVAVVMPIMRIRAGLEAFSNASRENAYTIKRPADDDVSKAKSA